MDFFGAALVFGDFFSFRADFFGAAFSSAGAAVFLLATASLLGFCFLTVTGEASSGAEDGGTAMVNTIHPSCADQH